MSTPDNSAMFSDVVHVSVCSTFESIFGSPPKPTPLVQTSEGQPRVASIISFFGTTPWAMTLVLPEKTAVAMALKFTGFDVPFDCSDMGDVVGELTNVLAGEIVAQLSRRNVQSQMSLPAVARGNDIDLLKAAGSPVSRLEYESNQGPFWFDVCTASNSTRHSRRSGTAA